MLSNIDFNNYGYFPALRTRVAEIKGLFHLTDERKDKIIPLITAGKWPRADHLDNGIVKAKTAMNKRPFFLDLTEERNALSHLVQDLKNPENGFSAWINYVKTHEMAIPVIQSNRHATKRDIIKQAQNCEKEFGKLAFRLTDFNLGVDDVVSAVSALDDTDNAMIFIDSKYIRSSYLANLSATVAAINSIRTEIPSAFISTLATSFPTSPSSFAKEDNRGSIDIMERELHRELGGYDTCAYGDYSSIHAVVYDDASPIMNWSARIDYPLYNEWDITKKPSAKSLADFREIARSVLARHPEIANSLIWGDQMIHSAATGGETAGASPASWIAVRVNLHLSRQIDYTTQLLNPIEFEEDGDEDADFV